MIQKSRAWSIPGRSETLVHGNRSSLNPSAPDCPSAPSECCCCVVVGNCTTFTVNVIPTSGGGTWTPSSNDVHMEGATLSRAQNVVFSLDQCLTTVAHLQRNGPANNNAFRRASDASRPWRSNESYTAVVGLGASSST